MYANLNLKRPDAIAHIEASCRALADAYGDELRDATRACRFPREIYREMGQRQLLAPMTAADAGGMDGGVGEYCVVTEEVARHGLVSPQVSIQAQLWLRDWGTPEQCAAYLAPIASGEMIFSESISEPGVGSSLRVMQSTARRDGTDWLISGVKTHVNLGHVSDLTLVYAMAPEGLTGFFVPTDTPGFSSVQTEPIGGRLLPTAQMTFDDVRVPKGAVLGEVGGGLATFLTTFNVSRLGNASELLGTARRALADAVEYASEREVGSNRVTDFQGIQWIVADCYSALHAASLVRNDAANRAGGEEEHALAATLAKRVAIEAAEKTVNEVFSLVGGHGLYSDTHFGQLLHDVKVMRVAGGSLEVLRNYIAKRVLSGEIGGTL